MHARRCLAMTAQRKATSSRTAFSFPSGISRGLWLAAFLVLVVGGGSVIGLLTGPGPWYASLQKPSFNPPSWVFGPVWTVLYVLVAVAGWRAWRTGSAALQGLWWLQLGLNFLWSPVFFALHRIVLALAVIVLLLASIVGFMAMAFRQDRTSFALFAPYVLWVGFASALNGAFYALNGAG